MNALISKRKLQVYYDYASPFVYIAGEILPGLVTRFALDLVWKPIDLHALSNFAEGLPYSPLKRAYVGVDALRTAQYHGVALNMPKPFPVQSGAAMRLALAAQALGGFDFLHELLARAAWRDQRDLADPAVLTALVAEAGLADRNLFAEADNATTTARLQANTAEAEACGVFGVPTMVLDGELFWGVDSLPTLAWRLAGSTIPAGPRLLPGAEGV